MRASGGLLEKLTISTDASKTSLQNLLEQIRACILEHKIPIEQILPCVTANTARVLKLNNKGTLEAGKSADILVFDQESFELREVISGGRRLMKKARLHLRKRFSKKAIEISSLKAKGKCF